MTLPERVVLLRGLEDDNPTEPAMKFRLTYEGELRATQRDPERGQTNPLAAHKHAIRREFHRQLKQLWETDRFLSEHRVYPDPYWMELPAADNESKISPDDDKIPLMDMVAGLYKEHGYRFVPLVREQWSLLCSLDILILRRDFPGSGVVHAGDIDNRIKTIIDALRRPRSGLELVGKDQTPDDGEDPFFVLMEDDSQVSHLSVEADVLLDPLTGDTADNRRARVLVTVELRPYYVTSFNLSLAGS